MGNKLSVPSPPVGSQATRIQTRGYLALLLVSAQFGIQPFLNERYLSSKSIKSSVVLVQECVKFIFCILCLSATRELSIEYRKWNLKQSLLISFIPAAIYNVQNLFAIYAYHNLDPLIFNLMNQTKIIWAAIFLKLILNKSPSKREMISLSILLLVALMLSHESRRKERTEKEKTKKEKENSPTWYNINRENNKTKDKAKSSSKDARKRYTKGLIAMLIATVCSGLAGVLTQRALQNKQRNTLVFSAELALYGNLFGLARLYAEKVLNIMDGKKVKECGLFYHLLDDGDLEPLIAILSNVVGGVGVGMVTKYTSVIHKSYALIAGIFITLLMRQYAFKKDTLSSTVFIAVPMTMASLWLKIS